MDYFRSKPSQTAVDLDDVVNKLPSRDSVTENLERKMLLERVEKCLSARDPRSRRIFWLYHRHGLKPRAIAAMPGIEMGVSGVETEVYRSTKAVRDCLQRLGILQTVALHEGGRA
jgi:DNA-directed RNA polymerase specialized sigma24 family protein